MSVVAHEMMMMVVVVVVVMMMCSVSSVSIRFSVRVCQKSNDIAFECIGRSNYTDIRI